MEQKPKPILLAFLVADTIIEDVNTKKKSLIGLFNSICATKFPFSHPEMNIFLSLTEGYGDYTVNLACARSVDEKILFKTEETIHFKSPTSVLEINFTLRNVSFPEPGKYSFQFFCNHDILAIRPFDVVSAKHRPK